MLQPVTTLDRQVTLRSVDNNDLFIFRSRLHLGERAFILQLLEPGTVCHLTYQVTDIVKTFKND